MPLDHFPSMRKWFPFVVGCSLGVSAALLTLLF
jgi:hypothetical protein